MSRSLSVVWPDLPASALSKKTKHQIFGRDSCLHILEIKLRTMTDMYRPPRVSEAKLTAYPHEERGQEVRGWMRRKRAGFDASVGRVVALRGSRQRGAIEGRESVLFGLVFCEHSSHTSTNGYSRLFCVRRLVSMHRRRLMN